MQGWRCQNAHTRISIIIIVVIVGGKIIMPKTARVQFPGILHRLKQLLLVVVIQPFFQLEKLRNFYQRLLLLTVNYVLLVVLS